VKSAGTGMIRTSAPIRGVALPLSYGSKFTKISQNWSIQDLRVGRVGSENLEYVLPQCSPKRYGSGMPACGVHLHRDMEKVLVGRFCGEAPQKAPKST
jgi:hypothetical protein